jgi:hypothetical protein
MLQPAIEVPIDPLQAIKNYFYFGHAHIGSPVDKQSFNWAVVCRQTSLGGLGIFKNSTVSLSVQHIQKFTNLWEITLQVHLLDNVSDSIIWELTDLLLGLQGAIR